MQPWMHTIQDCTKTEDWTGVIRASAGGLEQLSSQGLWDELELSRAYIVNLELACGRYRKNRQQAISEKRMEVQTVVVGSELSHNAAGRAHTLLITHQQLGYQSKLLGCHFPLPTRKPELWEPLQSLALPAHTFIVRDHSQFFWQAWRLVLQHPSDLVHLSKPKLPAVVFGLLYKLLWGASVLMDIDDEELCFVGESEPISVNSLLREQGDLPPPEILLGPLWTRLAVDLGQRFDGTTVANANLQQRYGGIVIPHGRDPNHLRPITPIKRRLSRIRFGIPEDAKVVLFFGTPRKHKGLLEVAAAVSALPEETKAIFVVVGAFPDKELECQIVDLLPPQNLRLIGNQPFNRARDILALADLVILLSSGEVAEFQTPAKLSDAMAVGLPIILNGENAPLKEAIEHGWAIRADSDNLGLQLKQWLNNPVSMACQGVQARQGFVEALALPVVAERLQSCVQAVLAAPRPIDSQQVTVLESLAPSLGRSLQAHKKSSHYLENS
jgi:glycosyltransferase involved in cell wall biosynthesis